MMGGGGSMMGAIISLKNNKALLKNKRRANWKNYVGNKIVPTKDHIKASPELLAQIREKFKAERKQKVKENIFYFIITIIILIILFYAIYWLYFFDNSINVYEQ